MRSFILSDILLHEDSGIKKFRLRLLACCCFALIASTCEGFAKTGEDNDWRWTEEWLPHAAWYLYAVSLPHN